MTILISDLLGSFEPEEPNFRLTEIYNECWLVKLVLHQASMIEDEEFALGFLPGSTWFSEGLLPTAFKARYRGDKLSESRTNADGVIGHILVGEEGKADLALLPDATQFVVVEAKIHAPLSTGTTNAPGYDQAARNVACMAKVMGRASINPASLSRLAFIVLAPQDSINEGVFSAEMDPASIRRKVQERVGAYRGELDEWHQTRFLPIMEHIRLQNLSWEEILDWITNHQPDVANDLDDFYRKCLRFS